MSDSTQIEWYLARDGQQHGPVTDAELHKLIELGHLRPTDLVWRQGWADWQPATAILPPPGAPRPPAPAPAPAPAATHYPSGPHAHAEAARAGSVGPTGTPGHAAPHVRLDPEPAPAARSAGQLSARLAEAHPDADGGQHRGPAAGSGIGAATRSRESLADEHTVPHFQPGPGRPYAPSGPAAGDAAPRWAPQQAARRHDGPGVSPHARPSGPGMPHATTASPQPARPSASDADEEAGGFPWRMASVLVVLAALAGGGYALYKSGHLSSLPFLGAPASDGKVPVVSAPSGPVRAPSEGAGTAASDATASGTAASGATAAASPIEATLERSPLWALLKTSFPDWYGERVAEARRLASEGRDEREVGAALTRAVVDLRRLHKTEALQASPERLKSIAAAFVENLNRLSRHSTAACYGFISQGEASPAVTGIGTGELKTALDAQLVAIFEAVADGRKSPTKYDPPTREDYDALTAELANRAWTAADLQLFSDARALARAAPEKVCQMVNDWFSAQLAVKEPATQTRLLSEALKPVVGG